MEFAMIPESDRLSASAGFALVRASLELSGILADKRKLQQSATNDNNGDNNNNSNIKNDAIVVNTESVDVNI